MENAKIVIQKSGHSCSREVFVMRGSNCNVLIVNVFLLLVGGHCIGVSHSQEVFAAHSGFSVGFRLGSPSHEHRSHFLHLYAVEKYNVLLHIKDKSNKSN